MRAQQVVVEVAHDQPHLARAASPSIRCGCTKPSRPEVVSGESRSAGSAATIAETSAQRVDQLAVGGAGMHVHAARPRCGPRRPRSSRPAARRSPSRRPCRRSCAPNARDVEQRGALADLLVGREGDADRRARQLRVGGQVGDRGHDLRHPGLVVGAEQRVAAGGDDVVAVLGGQGRHRRRVQSGALPRQLDHAARDRRGARSARPRPRARPGRHPYGRSARSREPARRWRAASRTRSRSRPALHRAARPRAGPAPARGRARSGRGSWVTACARGRPGCRPARNA